MTDRATLLSYVERVEGYDSDAKLANEGKRDVYKEARSQGYDPQAIKDLVAHRRDPDKSEKRSAAFEEYLALISRPTKNNAPARNSGPTNGHPESPSRARARDESATVSRPPRQARDSGGAAVSEIALPDTAAIHSVGGGEVGEGPAATIRDTSLSVPLVAAAGDGGGTPGISAATQTDPFNCIPEFLARV